MTEDRRRSPKDEILLKRGFSHAEIVTELRSIAEDDWRITTITKEAVQRTDPRDAAALSDMGKRLFAKDSMEYRFTTYQMEEPFDVYIRDGHPPAPPASALDPYIARLVRAVNDIGISTCMSCDGWHADGQRAGQMHLWMRDRYSAMWMWTVTEHVFGETWDRSQAWCRSTWYDKWEPSSEDAMSCYPVEKSQMICRIQKGHERAVYAKNDRYAAFIEAHAGEFNALRDAWVRKLAETGAAVDDMGFLALRREVVSAVAPGLEALGQTYRAAQF